MKKLLTLLVLVAVASGAAYYLIPEFRAWVENRRPDGPPPRPELEVLGHGWSVFADADETAKAVKARIVTLHIPKPEKLPLTNIAKYTGTESRSLATLVTQLTVQGSIEGARGAFSGKVESRYDKSENSKKETYAAFRSYDYSREGLRLQSETIRAHLEPAFKKALEDPGVSPSSLFAEYGTHVVSKVAIGGRLNIFIGTESDYRLTTEDFKLAVEASYGVASAKAKISSRSEALSVSNQFRQRSVCLGGTLKSKVTGNFVPTPEALEEWEKTIEDAPEFVGLPDESLIPIWSFCSNAERQATIEAHFGARRAELALQRVYRMTATSPAPTKTVTNATLEVEAGYKILCGGATVTYNGFGMLLTSSYPQNAGAWFAEANDFGEADSGSITINALAIHDPDDHWYVHVHETSSGASTGLVKAAAMIPESFKGTDGNMYRGPEAHLVGGGGKATHSHAGRLLVWLVPVTANGQGVAAGDTPRGFKASSTDHNGKKDRGVVTAYAVTISPKTDAARQVKIEINCQVDEGQKSHFPEKSIVVSSPWNLVGGGAACGESTQFLISSDPISDTTWRAKSKDHLLEREYPITAYALGMKAEFAQP